MKTMKVVTHAVIEPVRRCELSLGDYILWANRRCQVVKLVHNKSGRVVKIHIKSDDDVVDVLTEYVWYNRIIDYDDAQLCSRCYNRPAEKQEEKHGLCQECYKLELIETVAMLR